GAPRAERGARAAAGGVRRGDRQAAPPPPPTATPERHQRHRPLLGRRDPLGSVPLAVQERQRTRPRGGRTPTCRPSRPRRRDRPLRRDDRPRPPRQDQGPPADPQTRGRALPPLRHHPRGRLLLRTPDELLPPRSDRRPRPQRPPPVETPEVGVRRR